MGKETWSEESRVALLKGLRGVGIGQKIPWGKLSQGVGHSGGSCRQYAYRDPEMTAEIERIHDDKRVITRESIPDLPIADLWARAEESNKRHIKKAQTQAKLTVDLGRGWKLVAFASDQHTCIDEAVDLEKMRLDAELIRDTPGAYVILAGDGVDNHIKHAAAVLHAKSTPHTQYALFDHYLGILGNKTIAMVTGNHDDWSNDIAGIDMMKLLGDRNGIVVTKDEALVTVVMGEMEYVVAVRHQYRYNSSFNQGHAVKRWWEMGNTDFDIGCLAHHHQSHFEPFEKHGIQRYAFRPGSYQIESAHSRRYGFNQAKPTCPCVVIGSEERDITPFDSLEKGVRYLKAMRGG